MTRLIKPNWLPISSDEEFPILIQCYDDGQSFAICNIYDQAEDEAVKAIGDLIAAAPDLLMCLQWLVGLKDNKPSDYKEQNPLAWAAARAAIEKATGETNHD